jgi:molybdopterin-binding protein
MLWVCCGRVTRRVEDRRDDGFLASAALPRCRIAHRGSGEALPDLDEEGVGQQADVTISTASWPYDGDTMEDADGERGELMGISAVARALGVSLDTLRRWEKDGRIVFERRGQRRVIRAADVARLLRERTTEQHSSARNRLDGIVLAVTKDTVMAQVEIACGPYRVVSLMSREAADELGLAPGVRADAVIKSTSVVVETRG